MFTLLEHALTYAAGSHTPLPASIHDEIRTCKSILAGLDDRPMHLREMLPTTWLGVTHACGTRISGVCQDPYRQWFIWQSTFSQTTQDLLVSFTNPKEEISINDLDICAHLAQLALICPYMAPLAHILTRVDNTTEVIWIKRGRVRTASAFGPLLRDISLLT